MVVLGIETATPYGSVAVVDNRGLLAEATARIPMRHLEWLAPALDRILRDAEISAAGLEGVAVSQGPGGFTGLRIGVATAAAWAHALRIPAVAVSTLEALAAACPASGLVLPALDAKRSEVAAALFRRNHDGALLRLAPDRVDTPESLREMIAAHTSGPGASEPIVITGDALESHRARLLTAAPGARPAPIVAWAPRAAVVADLGRARLLRGERTDPSRLVPQYGRRPYAEEMG